MPPLSYASDSEASEDCSDGTAFRRRHPRGARHPRPADRALRCVRPPSRPRARDRRLGPLLPVWARRAVTTAPRAGDRPHDRTLRRRIREGHPHRCLRWKGRPDRRTGRLAGHRGPSRRLLDRPCRPCRPRNRRRSAPARRPRRRRVADAAGRGWRGRRGRHASALRLVPRDLFRRECAAAASRAGHPRPAGQVTMITVIAHYTAAAGAADAVRQPLARHAAASRAEPGGLQFDAHQSIDNPDEFALVERYESQAAFAEYRTPLFRRNVETGLVALLTVRRWTVFGPAL